MLYALRSHLQLLPLISNCLSEGISYRIEGEPSFSRSPTTLFFDAYSRKRAVHEKLPPLRFRSSEGNTFAGFGQEISRLPVAEGGNTAGVTGLESGDREDPIL